MCHAACQCLPPGTSVGLGGAVEGPWGWDFGFAVGFGAGFGGAVDSGIGDEPMTVPAVAIVTTGAVVALVTGTAEGSGGGFCGFARGIRSTTTKATSVAATNPTAA
jgi:hypothetical protein